MVDIFQYKRRETSTVHIGDLEMGSAFPIRVQSMTTTNTNDTEACVRQAREIIDAGGELVRLTTQGIREAENLTSPGELPDYFIYLTLDPATIDVNIHPTKTEIKFENEQPIWQILSSA
ncbi:MAG: flavodoxin-dependent (E)-4-hydroxy-3-methylbut-2-enyl-diphosphate synthase, partial [Segatella oulorum]